MANLYKTLLRHTLFREDGSLVSLEKNYDAIGRLLRGRQVTGILDAGASTGRISMRYLRMFPKAHVYAFEPQPLYRQELTMLAQSNPRFHPFFTALSDVSGTLDLHVTKSPGTTSFFRPTAHMRSLYPEETIPSAVERVEVTTIDDWAAERGNPKIQLMKFDIQGAELKALHGAERTLRDAMRLVYIEISFNSLYEGGALFGEIDMCLRDSGFVLYNFFKPRSDAQGMLIQAEAIYLHEERLRA